MPEPAEGTALRAGSFLATEPGPALPGRRVPARHRPTQRSPFRARLSQLWPLTALVVVALVGARTLRGIPLPDDDALAAPAFGLLRGNATVAPLSSDGLGALHTAVYATVTRSFQRHASLAGAARELLWVLLLLSAVLLWRTARRLGLRDAAAAVAVLALGAVPVLAPLHAVSTPAAWAVPWLLLAAFLLAPGRPAPATGALAALAVVLAVLLAPATLLLVSAGLAAAVLLDRPRLMGSRAQGTAAAAVLALVFLGTRLVLGHWAPEPAGPQRWAAGPVILLLVTAALVVTGLLAGRFLPGLRAPAAALVLTALVAAGPPSSRPSALVMCLPVGSLLLGALVQRMTHARPSAAHLAPPRVAVTAVAAAALAVAVVAAAWGVVRADRSDFGAADRDALIGWAAQNLPTGSRLTAGPAVTAELVHAGADPAGVVVADDSDAPVPASTEPGQESAPEVLHLTGGDAPAGATPVARFGARPSMLVVDPQPGHPGPEAVARRRSLAAALLANPQIGDSAQVRAVLDSAQVDPRLLSLLAGMAAQFGVGVAGFPVVPEEHGWTPVRSVVIATVAGASLSDDPAAEARLRRWLEAQKPPYAPDSLQRVEGGLLVAYRYVSDPDGEISPSGP